MLDIFYTVFKFKEKESPDKLGLYPERDYTIEYEYSSDRSGNITLCNYRYEGQPASVTYKY